MKFLKQYRDVINFLLTGMNTIFILVLFLFYFLELNPAITGTMGDTFGGLFSPVIGLVSIYYIVKTFNEQNQQNQRLKNKEQVDRVTDIIYRQLERIDDNLRSHSFSTGLGDIEGRRGMYTLNTVLATDLKYIDELNKNDSRWIKALDRLFDNIDRNIDPLVDYFDHIFISLAIIDIAIMNAEFDTVKDEKESLRLFFLNLSAAFEITINRYKRILNLINNEYDTQKSDGIERLHNIINSIHKITTKNIDKVIND